MKQMLPNGFKFPFWWLFKAPQRKLGWYTLWNDLLGLWRFIRQQTPFRADPKPISICVGLYNRSETFLNKFIPTLSRCEFQEHIELSVFDCGSDDALLLEKKVKESFLGKVVFVSQNHPFQRSYAINRAVGQSTQELVFICDADFSLPPDLVQKCASYTHKNSFWFPIVFYLYKNKPELYAPKNGEWMLWGGKGILACTRESFNHMHGLDESFTQWGGEDEAFWMHCHAQKQVIIRTREKGLLHHWHPSLNPKYKKLEELTDMGLL